MKKTLLIVAVVGLAMASCKKNRTCECVDLDKTDNTTFTVSYTIKTTKKQMEAACGAYNYEDPFEKVTCSIK